MIPVLSNTRDKISEHFCHYEVVKSSTADRYEIDNFIYDEETKLNAIALAENILEPIRNHFGIPFGPTSWFRCEHLERRICSKGFSNWCVRHDKHQGSAWQEYFERKQHPQGASVDIEISSIPNDDLYQWIAAHLEYDQLIREFPRKGDPMSGWVHVSWNRHGKNRKQAFTIG